MITLRYLGVVIFSVLLTGCAQGNIFSIEQKPLECAPPGAIQTKICRYDLEATTVIDKTSGSVRGKVAESVLANIKAEHKDFNDKTYVRYEFNFVVKDFSDKIITPGKVYSFLSEPNESHLILCDKPCEGDN